MKFNLLTSLFAMTIFVSTLVPSIIPTVANSQTLPNQTNSITPFTKANLLNNGGIAFNFDDGNSSVFLNAVPILDKYNIKGTFAIIGFGSTKYDFGSGYYASNAMIRATSRKGHVMASHSMDHYNSNNLSQIDLEYQLSNSKLYLQNLIGAQVNHFVAPYCAVNDNVIKTAKKYYSMVSICGGNGNNTNSINPFAIDRKMVESNTSLTQINNWIKQAKAKKQLLVLTFHHVGYTGQSDQNISTDGFLQIVNMAIQSKMPIGTTELAIKFLK